MAAGAGAPRASHTACAGPLREDPARMPTSKTSEHAFGTGDPFSVGAEEELFLVDAVSGRMVNSSGAVAGRLGSAMDGIERELHAGMIEFVSEVCSCSRDAVGQLGHRRAAAVGTGVGLLGSGTHPTATENEAEISDKERYERIHRLLGDAIATPVAGLHVHVGMPDPDTAIKVFNAIRARLPLLQALAANSPFRHGRDTGLASARDITIRSWPRSGVPRAMRDFDDFRAMADLLTRAAGVEDYTWFWWKLRPHPKLGTVEIRALDAQSSLHDAGALIAFVHCLARAAAEDAPPASCSRRRICPANCWRRGCSAPRATASARSCPMRTAICTRSTTCLPRRLTMCIHTRESSTANMSSRSSPHSWPPAVERADSGRSMSCQASTPSCVSSRRQPRRHQGSPRTDGRRPRPSPVADLSVAGPRRLRYADTVRQRWQPEGETFF
jgi:carboxylate-amine ligase